MPNVTIYIRQNDMDKWQAIGNKPEWLHLALEGTNVPVINRVIQEKEEIAQIVQRMPLNKEGRDYSLCKHGQVRGFCKQGCK